MNVEASGSLYGPKLHRNEAMVDLMRNGLTKFVKANMPGCSVNFERCEVSPFTNELNMVAVIRMVSSHRGDDLIEGRGVRNPLNETRQGILRRDKADRMAQKNRARAHFKKQEAYEIEQNQIIREGDPAKLAVIEEQTETGRRAGREAFARVFADTPKDRLHWIKHPPGQGDGAIPWPTYTNEAKGYMEGWTEARRETLPDSEFDRNPFMEAAGDDECLGCGYYGPRGEYVADGYYCEVCAEEKMKLFRQKPYPLGFGRNSLAESAGRGVRNPLNGGRVPGG